MLMQILKIMYVTEWNRWENSSNYQISAIIYRRKLLGKIIPSMKYFIDTYKNYITNISVKRATTPFVLITLVP